jgi:hypothetical protein
MAERGRFELPEPVKVQRFSRPPQSTTLPPLRDKFSLTWREMCTVLQKPLAESRSSGDCLGDHRRELGSIGGLKEHEQRAHLSSYRALADPHDSGDLGIR